jgi:dephospho-CoA kinase
MKKAGIEQGEANEKAFRIAIREKEGANFAMERVNKQVHELAAAGQHRVVIDGIYTWEEYKLAKHEFPGELKVVAIVAPKQKRYHWLETRETRPQTIQESSDRDHNEIEDIQKGGPIAAADFYVINDGSIDKLNDRLDEIAAEIQF